MPHIVQSIYNMFEGFSGGTVTGKILIALGTIITSIYSPIVALLATCFAFTTVDMIYGLKVARKYKHKIESSKGWKGTLTKLLDEFTIISLARLLEYSILGNDSIYVLTGGSTIIIALTELWSIIENLNTINPDGPWKALGKFLKKKGEEHIGIELDLDEEFTKPNTGSSKKAV